MEDPRTNGMTNATAFSMIVFRHDPEAPVSAISCVTLPRNSVCQITDTDGREWRTS